jgi:hypothetical protein
MLDIQLLAYVVPTDEQPFQSLTPSVRVSNAGDVDAVLTGIVNIYRVSTGLLIYSSQLTRSTITHGTTVDVEAQSPWSPPAPAADDYLILVTGSAAAVGLDVPAQTLSLGSFIFDVTPQGMGPAPAAHGTTHELSGSDPLEVSLLATSEMTASLVLKPDGSGGVTWAAIPTAKGAFTETSSATPTPDVDLFSQYALTALGEAAAFQIPSGTPIDGQKLILRILDDNTPRATTWDAVYASRGATLPATTVSGKTHYIGLIFNDDAGTWDCVAATVEA